MDDKDKFLLLGFTSGAYYKIKFFSLLYEKPRSGTELYKLLNIMPADVYNLSKKYEELKLIVKKHPPKTDSSRKRLNRRTKLLYLTQDGKKLAEACDNFLKTIRKVIKWS